MCVVETGSEKVLLCFLFFVFKENKPTQQADLQLSTLCQAKLATWIQFSSLQKLDYQNIYTDALRWVGIKSQHTMLKYQVCIMLKKKKKKGIVSELILTGDPFFW